VWLSVIIIYLLVLTLSKIIGLVQYKAMDNSSRIMVIYLCQAWLCETLAVYAAFVYKDNRLIYHVFSIIQFLIICWYYHRSIMLFKRYPIALILGVAGFVFGVINGVYYQRNQFNTNFLIVESTLVIAMTLLSLYELLASDDDIDLIKHPQFRFSCLLLIFWSFTFTYWLMQTIDSTIGSITWIAILVNVINIICYSGFGLVFLSFRKNKLT
jgi:hypothetical protein